MRQQKKKFKTPIPGTAACVGPGRAAGGPPPPHPACSLGRVCRGLSTPRAPSPNPGWPRVGEERVAEEPTGVVRGTGTTVGVALTHPKRPGSTNPKTEQGLGT